MHGPGHNDDVIDIDHHIHDGDANAHSSKDGAQVPYLDGAPSGILPHDDFEKVHGNCSSDDQKEIGNEKGTSTILETQVRKPESSIFKNSAHPSS